MSVRKSPALRRSGFGGMGYRAQRMVLDVSGQSLSAQRQQPGRGNIRYPPPLVPSAIQAQLDYLRTSRGDRKRYSRCRDRSPPAACLRRLSAAELLRGKQLELNVLVLIERTSTDVKAYLSCLSFSLPRAASHELNAMSQALGRGFRGLSGVPVFSRARQGVVVHRGQSSRYVQIRAAPSGQPGTINGAHLPVSGVSTTAESPGACRAGQWSGSDANGTGQQMRDSMSLARHTRCFQFLFPLRRIFTHGVELWLV